MNGQAKISWSGVPGGDFGRLPHGIWVERLAAPMPNANPSNRDRD